MTHSESINELATALAKAQGEIEGATKDKINPHFKSAYADLASVWDACRKPLTKNGLAVTQLVSALGADVTVTTLLTHGSGQWIKGELTMTAQQNTPQGLGSCITYARRYALSAMVGVAPEDDDGEAASKTNGQNKAVQWGGAPQEERGAAPDGFDAWFAVFGSVSEEGTAELKKAWAKSRPEFRDYLMSLPNIWMEMKKRAAKVDAAKVSA